MTAGGGKAVWKEERKSVNFDPEELEKLSEAQFQQTFFFYVLSNNTFFLTSNPCYQAE